MARLLSRVAAALCLLALGTACTFAQAQSLPAQAKLDESRLVRLSGTVHPLARPENDRGVVADSFPANRMLVLLNPPADRQQALATFLREAHAQGSPSYHKWLSPEEFGAQFGARDEDVQPVQAWLQAHGFAVTRLTKSRRFLEFSGSAAQVREALHTAIHQYVVAGNTYYAIADEVSIPQAIADLVKGFAPLNNFPLTSYVHTAGKGALSPATKRVTSDFTTTTSNGAPFYALAPEDFATQYDVTPVYQAGLTGVGQTIGILGTSNLDLSVTAAYRKMYGLSGDNTQVVIDGEDPGVGLTPNVEGFLDVEVSGAVAPRATVNFYTSGGVFLQSSLVLSALRAIEDNQASVLSVSYGECEQLLGPHGNQLWAGLWEQAAAQGQTVLVASGDSGPSTCRGFGISVGGQSSVLPLSVNGLASTPWNVAIGGTDFYYSDFASGGASIASLWNATNDANSGSLKAPLPEQPWSNPLGMNIISLSASPLVIPGGAGGGGPSSCSQFNIVPLGQPNSCVGGYAKPSWQNAPGVPADNVRDLPDVSLFAASGKNLTAYAICVEPLDCAPVTSGEPQVLLVGGTSASTPAMAGVMALVNQKYGRQGQANFTLYALARQQPAVFHDITVGTNDVLCITDTSVCTTPVTGLPLIGCLPSPLSSSCSISSFGVYAAGLGYDLASGLGSLDVNALVTNWSKITFLPTITTLQVSPASIVHGSPVSLTASVSANSGSNVPTGDVNISTTSPLPLIGTNEIALAAGTATANWNFFPGGTYQVAAQYAGDGTFATSTSTPSTLTVTPEPSSTTLTVNYEYVDPTTLPSIHAGMVTSGAQVPFSSIWEFAARPSGQASQTSGDATGSATFTDGSTSISVPLNSLGVAIWSPQYLTLGPHSVAVNYSGDASYNASTTAPLNFTVVKGTPQIRTSLEATLFSASIGAAPTYQAGSTVVVHVLLSALDSFVPPTGTVTVNFGSLPAQTAAVTAANYSNQGLSAVNFTFANVPAGLYTLSASYAGDANWNAFTYLNGFSYAFASGTSAATTTTLALTPASVDSSGEVKFTVTVTANQAQSGSPIGSALLSANGTIFAGVAVRPTTLNATSATGTVTVPGIALPSGALQVTAIYQGLLGFLPSNSTPVPLTVTFTNFTMSPAASSVIVKSGGSASLPLLLGGPNGGSATVSLSCLPSAANFACSVSPSSPTVRGATTASVTINAFTTSTAAAAVFPRVDLKRAFLAASATFSFLFGFIFVLPVRKHRRVLLSSAACLAAITFLAGCGGTSQSITPPPQKINTPPGAYNVVVTATSGTITHNAKFTVVVQ